ncbi:MAG TPA: Crp/Fnr family transcriptional regulator [Ignavibacteriales bacterium]|nr:Crp/Fnr family transcriptional regulator [Ignavibacteriales bacterium]
MGYFYEDILATVPIFDSLTKVELLQIQSVGKVVSFEPEQEIITEKEEGTALFVILNGEVRVVRKGDAETEVILAILKTGQFFGEMSLLDGQERSASVIANTKTELFMIQRNDFVDFLYTYPSLSISILKELTKRLRTADMKIKAQSMKDAEAKVASIIIQLADEIGKIKNGKLVIERLPLQVQIANMAGTSRETVSRMLHKFIKLGYIEMEYAKVTILEYNKFKQAYGL